MKKQLCLSACAMFLTLAVATIGCGGGDQVPSTGTGGTSGGGGSGVLGAIPGTPLLTFDADVQGCTLNNYPDMNSVNLAGSNQTPATPPTLMWDAADGSPATPPGSLVVTAPYTDFMQYVDIQKDLAAAPIDLTGKTLHVRLKVDSGFNSDVGAPGGVQISAFSTDAFLYSAQYSGLPPGTTGYHDYKYSTANATTPPPAGFDATKVRLIGVQLTTGGAGTATVKPTAAARPGAGRRRARRSWPFQFV